MVMGGLDSQVAGNNLATKQLTYLHGGAPVRWLSWFISTIMFGFIVDISNYLLWFGNIYAYYGL